MAALSVFLLALSFVVELSAFPAHFTWNPNENIKVAESWLEEYGYLGPRSNSDSDEVVKSKVNSGIKKVKEYYHITPVNDEMTAEVMNLMSEPRCKNGDSLEGDRGGNRRVKRYSRLGSSTWSDLPVLIGFKSFMSSRTVSANLQRTIAMECADLWAENSGLSFKLVSGRPHIEIQYERMDGEFGTVGTGQSPTPWNSSPSYLRLDSSDKWKPRAKDDNGVSFKSALCHEMGHTLGLGHSNDRNAVMYPSIQNSRDDSRIGSDDIRGIQALYGRGRGEQPKRDSPPPPKEAPKPPRRKRKGKNRKKRRKNARKRQQRRRS